MPPPAPPKLVPGRPLDVLPEIVLLRTVRKPAPPDVLPVPLGDATPMPPPSDPEVLPLMTTPSSTTLSLNISRPAPSPTTPLPLVPLATPAVLPPVIVSFE